MAIGDEQYIALTTFRRSGEAVSTHGWVVRVSDGRIGCLDRHGRRARRTRLRNDPRVTVQPCDVRGRPRDGAPRPRGRRGGGALRPPLRRGPGRGPLKYGPLTGVVPASWAGVGPLRRPGQQDADTVVLVRLDA